MAQAEAATKSVVDDIIFRSIGIGVSDLKRSVDFYTRVCGMKQLQTIKLDYMDEVIVGYSPEGTTSKGSRLVLMHWTDGSKRNYKDNPIKLVLGVPDAKAVADRIRAEGTRDRARADAEQGVGQPRRLCQGSRRLPDRAFAGEAVEHDEL